MKSVAVCYSLKCTYNIDATVDMPTNRGVQKEQSWGSLFCDDCGHALFWYMLREYEATYDDAYLNRLKGRRARNPVTATKAEKRKSLCN
jgi:hypothetical protein